MKFRRRLLQMWFVCVAVCFLTGCGVADKFMALKRGKAAESTELAERDNETSQVEESGGPDETGSQGNSGEEHEPELTLADGEAKLICHDGQFISIAYHGPSKDIGATFAKTDGERLGTFVRYGKLSDGWTIIVSDEFPEDYAKDNEVMLSVTDYNVEKNADGTNQREIYPFTETLTKDEAKEIGLDIIADHISMVSVDKPTYGWNNFTVPFLYVNFLDEYHGKSIEEIDGLVDSFSYYAEDGTPLEECFEGYTMVREPSVTGACISLYFYNDDTSGKSSVLEEQNKAKCDELKELRPYAVYTAADGTTQQFPFFHEE